MIDFENVSYKKLSVASVGIWWWGGTSKGWEGIFLNFTRYRPIGCICSIQIVPEGPPAQLHFAAAALGHFAAKLACILGHIGYYGRLLACSLA